MAPIMAVCTGTSTAASGVGSGIAPTAPAAVVAPTTIDCAILRLIFTSMSFTALFAIRMALGASSFVFSTKISSPRGATLKAALIGYILATTGTISSITSGFFKCLLLYL